MSLSDLTSNLNQLSTTDYFVDDTARGFTKNFKPGSPTKFKPFIIELGQSNSFVDDYAKGFSLNMKFPNTGFKLNKVYPFEKAFGERNSSFNFFDLGFQVNNGFKKNFILGESQYKKVQGKNFTWPLNLKRVDYEGNNLSPINDFVRQFPTMKGGLSSIMSYPESRLRQEFLHSTDIRFKYKQRYEFKKENQIRLDSNSTKHPLILQSLMDVNRYGWAQNRLSNVGHTTDFVRGGITTYFGTALTDQVRLGKFLTSGSGLWWLGKQFVLQYLNPRKETQLYNPLHINASIIPFLNVSRFINLRGQGAVEVMGFAKDGKGLYERTDGYDDWGSDGGRGLENKLAQYTKKKFDPPRPPIPFSKEDIQEKTKKEIRKAATKAIFSKLGDGINELAGKFRAESKPANTVNSQEHMPGTPDMKGKPLHRGTNLSTKGNSKLSDETGGPEYNTLEYKRLNSTHSYEKTNVTPPRALQDVKDGLETDSAKIISAQDSWKNTKKIKAMGDASLLTKLDASDEENTTIGVHKVGTVGHHGDKVSLLPYGDSETDLDLVKFQFYDKVNKKFIVFRATVSGLTDTISPEWASEKYIGRADSVHVYKGAERSLSFGFIIAPTTKQELFTLWEKLNYLTGLTYPKYDNNRMVAPWIEFTFGDMYKGVPGFIENLSYSIPDNAPYEIDNVQLPKVIEATMGFKYIGNNLQTMQGKHFDLPWLEYSDQDKLSTMKPIPDGKIDGKQTYKGAKVARGAGWAEALRRAGIFSHHPPAPERPKVSLTNEEVDLNVDDWENWDEPPPTTPSPS